MNTNNLTQETPLFATTTTQATTKRVNTFTYTGPGAQGSGGVIEV